MPGPKRKRANPEDHELWRRQRAQGISNCEIAERSGVDEGTVRYWLDGKGARRAAESPPPPPPPTPRPAPAPEVEAEELSPDELRRLLSNQIRTANAAADEARAMGDPAEAKAQAKLAAIFAGHLRQIHSKADEDTDTIRVAAGDVQAAADRAMAQLQSIAERVLADVQAWPTCPTCGGHRGTFQAGKASLLEALFERVARGG